MAETKKASTTKKPRATTGIAVAPKEPAAKKKPVSSKVLQMASHDEIARLAHRYWAERGHQDGHDAEDWLRAEQELRGKAS